MSNGLWKIDGSIAKQYALRDWELLRAEAERTGRANIAKQHRPEPRDGVRRIDKKSVALVRALGLSNDDVKSLGLNSDLSVEEY
jgi:hypothetical protein